MTTYMPKNQALDMEGMAGTGLPNTEGRIIDPDKPDAPKKRDISQELPGMEEKLQYIPNELKERVSKLTRDDLAMPGMPRDKEAYDAYLTAEKIIRDKRRQKEKHELNFDGIKYVD